MHRSRVLSQLRALFLRDLGDTVRNPTVLGCCLFVVAASAFFRRVWAIDDPETPAVVSMLALALMMGIANGMVGGVILLSVVSEEQERNTYGVLLRAGVTPALLALSKVVVATVATAAVGCAAYLALGLDVTLLPPCALLLSLGTLPFSLLYLICGLSCHAQNQASVCSVPMVIVMLAPVIGLVVPSVALAAELTPLGPAVALVLALYNGTLPLLGVPLLILVYVAWVGGGVLVLRWALRLFACRYEHSIMLGAHERPGECP